MFTRALPYLTAAALVSMLKKTGGFREIIGFTGYANVALTGGIILNILIVLIFSEIYYIMDQNEDGKHFGFSSYTDALYFTTVTSSSCGFGDILAQTKQAKIVVTMHLMIQFFVIVPLLLESFKPGN